MSRRVVVGGLLAATLVAVVVLAYAGGDSHGVRPAAAAPRPWCPGAVSPQQARRKVGSVVWVKGRVLRARFALAVRGRPTTIDLGVPRLSVVVRGRDRRNFPAPPERMFRVGRAMCVHGIVERRRGVPTIAVEFWDAAAGAATF